LQCLIWHLESGRKLAEGDAKKIGEKMEKKRARIDVLKNRTFVLKNKTELAKNKKEEK